MVKKFTFQYRCSDIARLIIGNIKLSEYTNKEAKLKSIDYIKNIYKNNKCNIFLLEEKVSKNNIQISHNEETVINTAVLYK